MRLFAGLRPPDAFRSALSLLQDRLRAAGVTGQYLDPSNLHMTLAFVGEWPGGDGAVEFVKRTDPDVVLLDIRMPDRDGVAVLGDILAARPKQKVIMLTTSDADNDVYRSLTLGAKGYLLKDRDATEITSAINRVMQGGKFVPDSVMELFRSPILL